MNTSISGIKRRRREGQRLKANHGNGRNVAAAVISNGFSTVYNGESRRAVMVVHFHLPQGNNQQWAPSSG